MFKRTYIERILAKGHEYMTYLFFFLLSMPDSVLPAAIGLWGLTWLMWRLTHRGSVMVLSQSAKTGVWFFLAFVLFHFMSGLWGFDPSLALRMIEHQLSFVILLVVMLGGVSSNISSARIINSYFVGAVVSVSLFTVSFVSRYYTDDVLKYQLDAVGIANVIDAYKHPAYWCLNLILATSLFFQSHLQKSKVKWGFFLSFILVGIFIYFSGSRAGLISLVFIVGATFIYYLKNVFGIKRLFIFLLPIIILFALVAGSSNKFHSILDNTEQSSVNSPRKVLWSSAIDLISDAPIFGYGIGSSKVNFIEKTKENGIYNAEIKQYNAHNQFLELLLENGFVGLILLLLSVFFLVKNRFKSEMFNYLSLLFIISFSFLFESMLLRIAGVTTFSGFMIYLVYASEKERAYVPFKDKYILLLAFFLLISISMIGFLVWDSENLPMDPNMPQTYASKVYTIVPNEELPGLLPIALANAEASCFDSTAVSSMWSGNAYMLNQICSRRLHHGEQLVFSTYCYVSDDFNGTWVKASVEPAGKNLTENFYDLSKKGTWQELRITIDGKTGEMPAYHYFCKENCNSFDDLKGYVLFAYPQYTITKK